MRLYFLIRKQAKYILIPAKYAVNYSHLPHKVLLFLSDGYFSSAANVLEVIVANVPSSTKYLQALATVYSCLKDKDRLAVANGKLASIGGQTVDVNVAPSMIAYSDRASSRNVYASASVTPSSVAAGQTSSSAIPDDTPPLYSQYAKDYVERRIRWLLMSFPNG